MGLCSSESDTQELTSLFLLHHNHSMLKESNPAERQTASNECVDKQLPEHVISEPPNRTAARVTV